MPVRFSRIISSIDLRKNLFNVTILFADRLSIGILRRTIFPTCSRNRALRVTIIMATAMFFKNVAR